MKRPVIGLTLDSEPAGGYSNLPWYAIRENYCGRGDPGGRAASPCCRTNPNTRRIISIASTG